jgi:UDP-N-acetylmuramoyl-L-alanyl-D-glutamate--2,6-diaminopimelate ligase
LLDVPGPDPLPGTQPSVRPSPGADRPTHATGVPLSAVASSAGLALPPGAGESLAVSGVTLDSRAVRPGDLFAAVPGANLHRADFAAAAVAAGAVAVLTDARGRARADAAGVPVLVSADPRAVLGAVAATIYGDPAEHLLTIAVTGTNGKTTAVYLLEAALRSARLETGLIGTIETKIGDWVLPSERTTPEATDLHALLATMVERGVDAVAMEVSSHALALGRVGGVIFDVAMFTNLGSDHLDFHEDREDYFRAKASLFTPEHARAAVVNLDDEYGRRLVDHPRVPTITYAASGDRDADWRAEDVVTGPAGTTFTAVGPGGVGVSCNVALPGRFNVDNALGALATLVSAGLRPDVAAAGLATCTGVAGRVERIDAGQDFLAVVDYAHTPEAIEMLLDAVRLLVDGRVIVVLGCGGDRDRGKRAAMGAAAARAADVVVVTDDNPRSEDPAAIRRAVLAGARAAQTHRAVDVIEVDGRADAIAAAVERASSGDCVVIAGKGHEQGQEIAGAVVPFDDRSVLRDAIDARARLRGGGA